MRLRYGAVAILASVTVSACGGGEEQPATQLAATGTIVFVAQVSSSSPGGVVQAFAADAAAGRCRRVLPPVRAFFREFIQVSGDGRVLVSRGRSRTITVADAVTGRRESLHAPADGITVSPDLTAVAWPDGQKLLVQSVKGGPSRVVAAIDGASVTIGPVLWSPTGHWLVFTVRTGGIPDGPPLRARVEVVSADGRERRTVHEESGYESDLLGRMSPDDATIAITGSVEGIFTVNRDGSGKRMLHRAFANSPLRWSPDGRRIAYLVGHDVWIASADGSKPRRRLKGFVGARTPVAWSPDGGWIALATGRHLTVARSDGVGTERVLCEVPPIVEVRGGVWIRRSARP